MAEILLSLTIIGVVAAITLPSLMANINERTWNTQRKALYARLSQAIAMMPHVAGYGTLTGTLNEDGTQEVTEDTAAETFLTEGLSKVLKINNICDSDHLADCGVPSQVTALTGSVAFSEFPKSLVALNRMFAGSVSTSSGNTNAYFQLDTKVAAYESPAGEAVAVFYNPNCEEVPVGTSYYYTQPKMCANFVYDLNGNKGPNTVGKDIGVMTVLYSDEPVVVAPMPYPNRSYGTYTSAISVCKTLDIDSRMPNKEELSSLFYNRELFKLESSGDTWWTGSVISIGSINAWKLAIYSGRMWHGARSSSATIYCVKR